jgi:hypothetical protein
MSEYTAGSSHPAFIGTTSEADSPTNDAGGAPGPVSTDTSIYCVYAGNQYSVGAEVCMPDGDVYYCNGTYSPPQWTTTHRPCQ